MTRPLQDRPCRQLNVSMDDALFELIDLAYRMDDAFSSRADVARSLMWAGAAVMLGMTPDDQPETDAAPAGPLDLQKPTKAA